MARSVLKNFLNTQSTASRFYKGTEIWKLPPSSLKIFKTVVLWFFLVNSELTTDIQKFSKVRSMHLFRKQDAKNDSINTPASEIS